MWDLETMKTLNAPKPTQGKVSSDGRVCTDYVSRPAQKRFYVEPFGSTCGIVLDSILMQGHGSFGPMPNQDAYKLCDLLNNLTMV